MIHGVWIGGGNLLRTEFELKWPPVSAEVLICGLGWFELYLNGERIGTDCFVPAQTDYEKRAFYLRYDVAAKLKCGRNAIGVRLGKGVFGQDRVLGQYGWASAPYGAVRAIVELRARNSQQEYFLLQSDENWLASTGGMIEDNVYWGEYFDARREDPLWACPGIDTGNWRQAVCMEPPSLNLIEQTLEPERITRRLPPQSITQLSDERWLYDFGENIAGVAELTVEAVAGTEIILEFAEEVDEHGLFDPASTGVFATGQIATDRYICNGKGCECWRPSFTYHGFRYCRVTGARLKSLVACEIHTDVRHVGRFRSSDHLAEQIYAMCRRTLLGNLHSLPTDCPAREKCGWLGDAQIDAEFAIYQFDCHKLLSKYMDDIATSAENQLPTMVAPGSRKCGMATPGWGTAVIQIPWYLYLYYGDTMPLQRHYDLMRSWLSHLNELAQAHIIATGLGDWCPPGSVNPKATPVALTSTVYYYLDAKLLSRIASVLGDRQRAQEFSELAERIRNAFHQKFFDREQLSYGSQTGNALALAFELVPSELMGAVAGALERDVREHAFHFTTGIMGLRHLFEQLSRFGYEETAWRCLTVAGYPGFADLLAQGATTCWETWEKNPVDEPTPRSRNHPMQTGWAAWLTSGVAGIVPDWRKPGWEHVILAPRFIPQLEWAEAELETRRGRIISRWERRNAYEIDYFFEVPGSSTFSMQLPEQWVVTRSFKETHLRLERQ